MNTDEKLSALLSHSQSHADITGDEIGDTFHGASVANHDAVVKKLFRNTFLRTPCDLCRYSEGR